jgi:hypothetical protein
MAPDKDVGVIVLTNETNVGFPDAIGAWTLDRLMGNPDVDHVAAMLAAAKAGFEADEKVFMPPPGAQPPPPLEPLAGLYANPSFGDLDGSVVGGALTFELKATGAKLRFEPRDGSIFAVTLVPEGPFAAIAANLGPLPLGFAQFVVGKNGKLDRFVLTAQEDGQAYTFTRRQGSD